MKIYMPLLILGLLANSCSQEKEPKITEYVNPFIGTAAHGHCFPGAVVPFGGIQLSPDNPREGWDWCSGYHYSDSIIASFSHTHLSGTGIGDLQDIRLLPVVLSPDSGQDAAEFIRSGYALFSHANEYASPGYYAVTFDNGIKTELSATERCGMHYYQYPDQSIHGLTIDLTTARNWDKTTEASLKKVNNRTLQGYRKSTGWANDQRVYFVIEFSQDFKILAGSDTLKPLQNGEKIVSNRCYAWLDFGEKTDKILAKVSLSSANWDGAMANLNKELSHWSFDKVKRDAKHKWKRELSKIKVEGKNEHELVTFYTALYHAYLFPSIYSDVNGNFKGADRETYNTDKRVQYTGFSLWDTFRASFPLFTITQRKRVEDMINSMLKHYDATGTLPMWELWGNEANCMIGNPAVTVISEAYLKGIRNFDVEKAYQAMKETVMSGRDGLAELRKYGYVPCDEIQESVSKTLEYAYQDWCIAQMAKALDKKEDYLYFTKMSLNFVNLFDPGTGLMRGKTSDREWKTPFSPLYSKHRADEYTEANAWQYAWFVPHNIEKLITLHGGKQQFARKLDSLFTMPSTLEGSDVSPDISGMIGQYAQGNEPSHHIAYLYNDAGMPHRTQYYVNKILTELYDTTPGGLCGNEDCGQLSSWYVLSAMGFYPVNPPDCKYQLTAPLFEKTTLKVGPEKRFTIRANKESEEYIYIKEIHLNNRLLDRLWITHEEIMNGGELQFTLSKDSV